MKNKKIFKRKKIRKGGIRMAILAKPERNLVQIDSTKSKKFIDDSNKQLENNKEILAKCKETSRLFKRK